MVLDDVPSYRLSGLSFGIYSSEEIRDLSVKEVTNPQSFDVLMHPTYGGLYDPSLGPVDRDDVCSTCGLSVIRCPGHMGHISLSLPVYNPVLFKTLFQLLKGSCFICHRLLLLSGKAYLFTKQLEALQHGLLSVVIELQQLYDSLIVNNGGKEKQAIIEVLQEQLEHCLQNAINDASESGAKSDKLQTKHVVECQQLLLKEFLGGKMFVSQQCPHCQMPVRKLRAEDFSKIYFSQGLKRNQALKLIDHKQKLKQIQRQMIAQGETPEAEETEMDSQEVDSKEKVEKEIEALRDQAYLTPVDARLHMQQVWKNDMHILGWVLHSLNVKKEMKFATDVFFIDIMPVAPSRFRPMIVMHERRCEHQQTAALSQVIEQSNNLRTLVANIHSGSENDTDALLQQKTGNVNKMEQLHLGWIKLQMAVNRVIDSDLDKHSTEKLNGIKQLLEKKEGLFRKHMMGKRVDFAARSVISPDPYINTNEIGIPLVFAKRLTYPQPVTPWNFHELKQAVINGPEVHPGACFVINEDGKRVRLSATDHTQRAAIAKQLLTPSSNTTDIGRNKTVERHLKNGDVLLLNRQPTLHKPSIQAHRARVLSSEKTLRLHYANCKAYNADFDGDEMNAHFPQNEIGRSEAINLISTDFQYLVPKDGTPLAGLIQDHMVSGVSLMVRGRFFKREDYHQLVFTALTDSPKRITLLPPTIIKPCRLWSGKQVVTTLLLNLIPADKAPLNLVGTTKVASKNWINGTPRTSKYGGTALKGDDMSESEVVIRHGELLVGVLDKGHYGNTPYGLVHCCYELYGGVMAGRLLTCLARLFTSFLQYLGFTLGVQDILVTHKADKKRRKIMKAGTHTGNQVAAQALNISADSSQEQLTERLREAHFGTSDEMKDLDLSMKGKTDEIQNKIAQEIMPTGLLKRFPHNNLQLMVQSGAKGSSVNCMQISCLLGQIELEGRRPAIMLSGRSLPSFQPYATQPRAGGFIDGRFLTGIRPQEYFFHCMAGREGLVDTAVKTSRSGYLQRCIIKHLEGITVNYDLTVRDSDGSIIQFYYGEDGLDVGKTPFLQANQFPFLINNRGAVSTKDHDSVVCSRLDTTSAPVLWKKLKKWEKKHDVAPKTRSSAFLSFCRKKYASVIEDVHVANSESKKTYGRARVATSLLHQWDELVEEKKAKYKKKLGAAPEPVVCQLRPDKHIGAVTENFHKLISTYTSRNPQGLLCTDEDDSSEQMSVNEFNSMLYIRNLEALAQPGEAVGLVAAQSIGEPSTQMTLNTFHFAGRGEMNVTLGIPRLREILMVASSNIKTPNMDIPLLRTAHAEKEAQQLKLKFTRVYLAQVLEQVRVCERLDIVKGGDKCRLYRVRFQFLPYHVYRNEYYLTPARILQYVERRIIKSIGDVIRKKVIDTNMNSLLSTAKLRRAIVTPAANTNQPEEDDLSDDDQHDNDTTATKRREQQNEELDYQGEEEEVAEMVEEGQVDADSGEDDDEDEVDDELMTKEEVDDGDTTENLTPLKKKKKKHRKSMDMNRVANLLNQNANVTDYTYDVDEELWCEVTYKVGLLDKKIDVTSLIETEAKKMLMYETPGITRCLLSESRKPGEEGLIRLKTEGVNILEMYKYQDILDLRRLYTNDIHAVASTYGIEAASRVIIKEVRDVFAAYGIQVDYRHLSLVADYMTYEGQYKPFNRVGIESNASPLQKMSFETTMHFLKTATVHGLKDDLCSPSARIVVGKLVGGGTGSFDLVQPSNH